jgi:hypothetical protein
MKTPLTLTALALILAACGGEVTDGGAGSDTDFEEIERENAVGAVPERQEIAGETEEGYIGQPYQEGADKVDEDALRAEDYPKPGQEMTRWPIEPGNEEPGGKDMLLAQEYAAMGAKVPETQRPALEEARENADAGLVTFRDMTFLTFKGASAARLMESEAGGPGGDVAGQIEDLILTGDGKIAALLIRTDMFGEPAAVPAEGLTIVPRTGEMGGPYAEIAAMPAEDTPPFDEGAMSENTMLASSLIGSPVSLAMGGGDAQIDDVVVTAGGDIEGIVLALQGERYALPWKALGRGQPNGGLQVGLSRDELRDRPSYVGEPAYTAAQ